MGKKKIKRKMYCTLHTFKNQLTHIIPLESFTYFIFVLTWINTFGPITSQRYKGTFKRLKKKKSIKVRTKTCEHHYKLRWLQSTLPLYLLLSPHPSSRNTYQNFSQCKNGVNQQVFCEPVKWMVSSSLTNILNKTKKLPRLP